MHWTALIVVISFRRCFISSIGSRDVYDDKTSGSHVLSVQKFIVKNVIALVYDGKSEDVLTSQVGRAV